MRDWLTRLKDRGADGVKFFGAPPALMQVALAQCQALGLRSGCHHAQMAVTRMNALTTAGWGLTSAEHYYGLPEALFDDRVVQDYPADYQYGDEYYRFSVAGQTFQQAAQPGSAKWRETLGRFLELGFTFVPTFNIYDANRDLMRTRRADWHETYTWKSYWDYFQPHRGGHGSYWYRWSTRNEIEWKRNYALWMQFINEFKNRGGRVCAGSDWGFIFQIFGFGFVRDLEMLQEAGFHPLEVLRAATLEGAHLLGFADDCGSIEIGKRADLLVHDQNPLEDFKLLYGTGAMRLNDDSNSVEWQRALRHTIAGGHLLRHGRTVGRCAGDGGGQLRRLRAGPRGRRKPDAAAMMGEAAPVRPIDLLVLTGFLGSGKTTLLSAYLRSPAAAGTAVIVNEIGEIGLDGALLSATADKVPMALLSNGCVCCEAGSDLPGTIAMLVEQRADQGRPLSRIVLETTGLATPHEVNERLAAQGIKVNLRT